MRGLFGLAMTVATVWAVALCPARAEGPMSPIYPTGPGKPAAAAPAKEKAMAPAKVAAPAAPKAGPAARPAAADEHVAATAPIPPPPKSAPADAEAAKKEHTEAKTADQAAASQSVKRHKRAARRSRYVRRYRAPYYPWPSYYGDSAETTGWGGGQFGPSPYSATGQ
jgi:type IV secretory pathway VirB10-like protein